MALRRLCSTAIGAEFGVAPTPSPAWRALPLQGEEVRGAAGANNPCTRAGMTDGRSNPSVTPDPDPESMQP